MCPDNDFAAIRAQIARTLPDFDLPAGGEPGALADRLTRYLELLAHWNRAYNLTAVRDPAAMVPVHVFDSLAVLPWLAGARVADVGTGAGLPGIPLALSRPDIRFTLVDSNGKKIRFVTHATGELGLANVTPVQARIEDYVADIPFDTIVSRAFSSLSAFIEQSAHLLAPAGRLVAMKGKAPDAELAELPAGWSAGCEAVAVPQLDAERHVVTMTRMTD